MFSFIIIIRYRFGNKISGDIFFITNPSPIINKLGYFNTTIFAES